MSSSANESSSNKNISTSTNITSLNSSDKCLADSLSVWRQEDNNCPSKAPLTTQVSMFLDLYHSHALSVPPSLQTSALSINECEKNFTKSGTRKDMIQSYTDFLSLYEKGLHEITSIQDFTQGYTPDNIMEGNFPSIPFLESYVKRNNPPPSSMP